MNKFRKALTLLLACLMVLSLAACSTGTSSSSSSDVSGSTSDSGAENSSGTDEVVTLDVMAGANGTKSGIIKAYWTDIYREWLGIEINLITFTDEKIMASMASDSMPDVTFALTAERLRNAINGDLILCLEDYQQYTPHVLEWGADSMQFQRDYVSEGTGKAWSVSSGILKTMSDRGQVSTAPNIRWDLYKQLGYPQVETLEDFIPLMKQFQELEPTASNGKKTYGFIMPQGWNYAGIIMDMFATTTLGQTEYNYGTGELGAKITDDDSLYLRIVKFLYDANQAGLINPDSMSMDWTQSMDAFTNGEAFFSIYDYGMGNYVGDDSIYQGFAMLPSDDMTPATSGLAPIGETNGQGGYPVVGKHTKYIEQAYSLIDAQYWPELEVNLNSGPQGVTWEIDEDGKPYVTEDGWDILRNNKELPGGGLRIDGLWTLNFWGLNTANQVEEWGTTMQTSTWPKKDYAPADTNLVTDWRAYWNDRYDTDTVYEDRTALNASGQLVWREFLVYENDVDEEMAALATSMSEVWTNYMFKMVFAANDSEFNSLKEEWKATMAQVDPDGVLDAYHIERHEKALELGNKYNK